MTYFSIYQHHFCFWSYLYAVLLGTQQWFWQATLFLTKPNEKTNKKRPPILIQSFHQLVQDLFCIVHAWYLLGLHILYFWTFSSWKRNCGWEAHCVQQLLPQNYLSVYWCHVYILFSDWQEQISLSTYLIVISKITHLLSKVYTFL